VRNSKTVTTDKGGKVAGFIIGQPFNPYKVFNCVHVPEALVRWRGVSPMAKFAYGRLARYAGEDGRCFPAVGSLAAELGIKERGARLCLAQLESEGLIKREFDDGKTTQYIFLWHAIFSEIPRQDTTADPGTVVPPHPGTVVPPHPGTILPGYPGTKMSRPRHGRTAPPRHDTTGVPRYENVETPARSYRQRE
jgi:hypothetical protein